MTLNLITTRIVFSNIAQPLRIGVILLIQTFLVALLRGTVLFRYWFSYILMLVFLGAILILFIYVSSLAPNQQFKIPGPAILIVISLIFLSFITFLFDPLATNTSYTKIRSFSNISVLIRPTWILRIIYDNRCYLVTSLIILYLFLTLVVVVKVVCPFFGPLRLNN